jgi:hypothetical protein
MPAVGISGTFPKDERPNNGLEAIYDDLLKDELTSRVIVGVVVPHAYAPRKVGEPDIPVVRFVYIEVVDGDNADVVREMIDAVRLRRNVGPAQPTLPLDGLRDESDSDDIDD